MDRMNREEELSSRNAGNEIVKYQVWEFVDGAFP